MYACGVCVFQWYIYTTAHTANQYTTAHTANQGKTRLDNTALLTLRTQTSVPRLFLMEKSKPKHEATVYLALVV